MVRLYWHVEGLKAERSFRYPVRESISAKKKADPKVGSFNFFVNLTITFSSDHYNILSAIVSQLKL